MVVEKVRRFLFPGIRTALRTLVTKLNKTGNVRVT